MIIGQITKGCKIIIIINNNNNNINNKIKKKKQNEKGLIGGFNQSLEIQKTTSWWQCWMTGTKGANNKPFVYVIQHGGDDVKPRIIIQTIQIGGFCKSTTDIVDFKHLRPKEKL